MPPTFRIQTIIFFLLIFIFDGHSLKADFSAGNFNHGPYEFLELKNGNLLVLRRATRPIFTIFDNDFNPVGQPTSTEKASDQFGILLLQNGGFYVYFEDSDIFTMQNETWYGQLFDSQGQSVGNAVKLFDEESFGYISSIHAVEMRDERIVILWDGITEENFTGLYARIIHTDSQVSDVFFVSAEAYIGDVVQFSDSQILLLTFDPNLTTIYDIDKRETVDQKQLDASDKFIWNYFGETLGLKPYENGWMGWWFAEPEMGAYSFDAYFQLLSSQFNPIGTPVYIDTFPLHDNNNIDIRYLYLWEPLPGRGLYVQKDKNDNTDLRDLHDFTTIFYNLNGQKIYDLHLGLYDERLVQTRPPLLLNDDELVYFWQENDPYINKFRMFIQIVDIATGQPIALHRHDGKFYDYPGIYQNRILILTEDAEGNVVKKYLPADANTVHLDEFHLLSPQNDMVIENCRPVIKWTSATRDSITWQQEVEYFVHLATAPDFSDERLIRVWGDTLVKTPVLDKGKTFFCKVLAKNASEQHIWSSETKAFFISHTAVDDGFSFGTTWFDNTEPPVLFERQNQHVSGFQLMQNYPNPFNSDTFIRYSIPEDGHVTLTLFDVIGRRVMVLKDGWQTAGFHGENWAGLNASGRRVSSGLYFCRLDFNGQSGSAKRKTIKMSMVR